MGRILLVLLVLLPPAVASSPIAHAQDRCGSVSGIVRDGTGDPLPGASVTLQAADRRAEAFSSETDERGEFSFTTIPAADYVLLVKLKGDEISMALSVTPAQDVALDLRLYKSAAAPIPPLLSVRQTASAHHYERNFIESLPLEREIGDFLRLSPGAVGDDLFSVHGGTVRGTRTFVEGIDITDPVAGLVLVDIPFEAIESLALVAGNSSASSNSGEGATIDLVLERGGDRYSGEAYLYHSGSSFANDEGGIRKQGERSQYDPAFSIGGPLPLANAWFFAAATYQYAHSKNSPTSFKPLKESMPALSAKAKWSAGDGLDFRLAYLGSFARNKRAYTPDSAVYEIVEPDADLVTADSDRSSHALLFEVSKRFSSDSTIRGKISYFNTALEVEPTSGDRSTPTVIDPYPQGGYHLYQGSYRPTWSDESAKRLALEADYSFSIRAKGRHQLQLAAQAESTDIGISGGYNGGYLEEYYTPAQLPYRRFSFRQNGGEGFVDNRSIRRYTAMLRDQWSLTPNLLMDLGLRIERSSGANDVADVFSWSTISPRLGIAWSPFADGLTILRAGFARYCSPMLGINIPATPYEAVTQYYDAATASWTNSPLNSVETVGYRPGYVDPDISAPRWDEWSLGVERELPGAAKLSLTYFQRRQQGIFEDIERNLWPNYTTETTEDLYGNEYTYYQQQPGLDGTRNPQLLLTAIDNLYRRYRGFELTLDAPLNPALRFLGSLTWSKTEGNIDNSLAESTGSSMVFDNPNERINADGYLSSDRRYSLRAAAVYAAPKAFYLSALLRMDSGAPLDRLLLNPDTGGYEIRSAPRGSVYRAEAAVDIDLRVEKVFSLPGGEIAVIMDIFNLTDDDSPIAYVTSDEGFGLPLLRHSPRTTRWGIRYTF